MIKALDETLYLPNKWESCGGCKYIKASFDPIFLISKATMTKLASPYLQTGWIIKTTNITLILLSLVWDCSKLKSTDYSTAAIVSKYWYPVCPRTTRKPSTPWIG
jgi:hypothetical protein